jgi:hypothetical protein
MKEDERPSYLLTVRPEPGVDGIRALRAWLKRGLRDFGLRCEEVKCVGMIPKDEEKSYGYAKIQCRRDHA